MQYETEQGLIIMMVTRVIKYHILIVIWQAVVVQKYNSDGNYGDVIDHNDGDVINHNSGQRWLVVRGAGDRCSISRLSILRFIP